MRIFHPSIRLALPLAVAGILVLGGCNDDDPVGPAPGNLIEVLDDEGFASLLAALEAAELTDVLEGAGPYTVFAPTDGAFAALPEGALEDPAALEAALLYHVVEGNILAADLVDGQLVTTVEGRPVRITLTEGPQVNGVDIIDTDISATNGVIHAVEAVLIPVEDNVDTAIAQGLSTLVTAVQEADLEDALRADGPFTIFAPTDEAFDDLPEGALEELLEDPDALAEVLTYHVLAGRVFASDLEDGAELETLQGDPVVITLDDGAFVNDAQITQADILTSNGVIHIIDAVLLPEE